MKHFNFKNKAFIPFITAGDPDIETTKELIITMQKAGADLIEIGIPFSDPVAEGLTIQQSTLRALTKGITTDDIFEMLKSIKDKITIPIALMTYINPIFTYGTEKFMKHCKEVGVSAVIVPDMPFEEKNEIYDECKAQDIKLISLIAITSKERLEKIAKEAEGFLYCVSSLGVTGVRSNLTNDIGQIIKQVKSYSDVPCMIGFGISTPEQAKQMSEISDGVIVGSAIVKIIEKYGINSPKHVEEYIRVMKNAIQ
ncbi:tryptophan synthase subunit alpha [Candidatus Epulonipiscioides gigas]|nr:tryptophan synthase subunit alpha [Epulopiscium sp. SCG-C07WGA-EpuloA2]